jgi:CheY-like chemotaxis protein
MKRILIVDDYPEFLNLLQKYLQDSYFVRTANNGVAAFELLKKHNYDMLITDVFMPGKDGLTLITEVRNSLKKHKMKIIAMSGGDECITEKNLHSIADPMVDAFFKKPLDILGLKAMIDDLLANLWKGWTPEALTGRPLPEFLCETRWDISAARQPLKQISAFSTVRLNY